MTSTFTSLGAFQSFEELPPYHLLQLQQGSLELTTTVQNTVRVRVCPGGAKQPLDTPSPAVLSRALPTSFERTVAVAESLHLQTPTLVMQAQLEPFSLSCAHAKQKPFLTGLNFGTQMVDGVTYVVARAPLAADAHIYGLGEKTGWLDKRFRRYRMRTTDVFLEKPEIGLHTDPLYAAFPVFLVHSVKGTYGIYVDNPEFVTFDFAQAEALEFAAPAAVLTFYILPGPTLPAVLEQYTALTGRIPLPALWTLGYHQCRWGYAREDDFRRVAHELRARRFPADAVWFDIDYMEGYRVFTWSAERFPKPAALLQQLQAQGLRAVTIVDPGVKVDPSYSIYKEGRQGAHFIRHPNGKEYNGNVWPGRSAFPDFHSVKTRAWWAHQVREWLSQYPIAALWNDMNEPASTDVTGPIDEVLHADGTLPHAAARNTYALHMARATYTGMMAHNPDSRPFILTRSAFSGAQTVAALWGGDNSAAWEHLAGSIPLLLNLGLSGMPFVGADIGGFACDTHGELLARWFQLGAFYPFCRNHAAAGTCAQEPWMFGPKIEAICRAALTLRYRLLPYIYGLFHEATRTGAPIMRPLVWHYAKDRNTFNLNDEFLLGRDLLVAPITTPGVYARAVYLPQGTWYAWEGDAAHVGGAYTLAQAPLETLPLYVRGGAILPLWAAAPNTDAIAHGQVEFHIWPGNGDLDYYEDDGLTRAFERGAQRLTPFRLRLKQNRLTLTVGPATGDFMHPNPRWRVVLHGAGRRNKAFDLQIDGKKQKYILQL